MLQRSFAGRAALGPIAGVMALGALLLTPAGIAGWPPSSPAADVLLAIGALGVACSALAFLLFFRLVAEVGADRATVITYLCPVVALAVGVPVLGEEVGPGTALGLTLILAGSWVATTGRLPLPRRQERALHP